MKAPCLLPLAAALLVGASAADAAAAPAPPFGLAFTGGIALPRSVRYDPGYVFGVGLHARASGRADIVAELTTDLLAEGDEPVSGIQPASATGGSSRSYHGFPHRLSSVTVGARLRPAGRRAPLYAELGGGLRHVPSQQAADGVFPAEIFHGVWTSLETGIEDEFTSTRIAYARVGVSMDARRSGFFGDIGYEARLDRPGRGGLFPIRFGFVVR